MRICFLNHTLDEATGAGRFGASLMRALKTLRPGIEISVLTGVPSGTPEEHALISSNKFRLAFHLAAIRKFFREADIIHSLDGYPYGVVAHIASRGLLAKKIITAVGTGALAPLRRPVSRRLLGAAYRGADALTAVSSHTREELLKSFPDLAVSVINHGVDLAEFSRDIPGALTVEERDEIEKLRPFVLSVGALKPRKGYEDSVEVFRRLRQKTPTLRCVIVGTGSPEDGAHLEAGGGVTWFKRVSRPFLLALYARAKLFLLLPYDDPAGDLEGYGLVFLEAAAAGLPVVGTRSTGAEDAVRDAVNGYAVPPRDINAAFSAAEAILKSPELYQKFSAGSRAFAEMMSWNHVARKYLALYDLLTK